jgi:hypothetical protein
MHPAKHGIDSWFFSVFLETSRNYSRVGGIEGVLPTPPSACVKRPHDSWRQLATRVVSRDQIEGATQYGEGSTKGLEARDEWVSSDRDKFAST